MASRGVSVLKFVGTVSLGLLTGLSYTLSTLTVPALLTLPSASTASTAFRSLAASARPRLRALAGISSAAFALAYFLSPPWRRHPYLLYTSVVVLGSRIATSDRVAPYLMLDSQSQRSRKNKSPAAAQRAAEKKEREERERQRATARRMEASYDVIGTSDSHSDGSPSEDHPEVEEDAQMNGEEVREEVAAFLKKQLVQTVVAAAGFVMAVVGIWGDGAPQGMAYVRTRGL